MDRLLVPVRGPAQVEIVNKVFTPSESEAERAKRIVEVYERGAAGERGAVALDGEMIDLIGDVNAARPPRPRAARECR